MDTVLGYGTEIFPFENAEIRTGEKSIHMRVCRTRNWWLTGNLGGNER